MTASKDTFTTAVLNRAFVASGVARFGRSRLPDSAAVFDRLEEQGDLPTILGLPPGSWDDALLLLARNAPVLPGPVGQLLRDYQLQMHEWFALALCGETEASYPLNLAIAELQKPAASARPSLHLLDAMAQELFGAPLPPLALPGHRLTQAGIFEIAGDGPLPTRGLVVPPQLWALLCGHPVHWLGTRPLPEPGGAVFPAALKTELPLVANLLRQGESRVLLFRGSREAGLAATAALAGELGMEAVEATEEAWEQSRALATASHYAGWLPVVALDLGPGDRYLPGRDHLRQTPLVLVCGRDGTVEAEGMLEIAIPPLDPQERLQAWRQAVGDHFPAALAEQSLLDGPTISALAERIRFGSARDGATPLSRHLRAARACFSSERLRLLAQPVTHHVEEEAIILSPEVAVQFHELVQRCLQRERLWQGLGASLSERAPGVRALFAGASGTGKTLAASRLATLLGAPLFRLDLAAVMNKYIGESEKNLGKVLDEAAALDAILLMDEADSLFGRRSEGKETGERYANMLTNFLLTRIENHPGIVLLTTNSRNRIDAAFCRRFDSIIEFSAPAAEERYLLWRSHLGSRAPADETCRLLAGYSDLGGGNIRNAVLHAAALHPASPGEPLSVACLLQGLRAEYGKLGRTLPPQLEHLTG